MAEGMTYYTLAARENWNPEIRENSNWYEPLKLENELWRSNLTSAKTASAVEYIHWSKKVHVDWRKRTISKVVGVRHVG